MARLLGASLRRGRPRLLVVVGRDAQRRGRRAGAVRATRPRRSCSRSAPRCRRHEGTTLEFIPGVGTFTEREASLMGRMSAAADRPLNWNVLIVMAGLAEQVSAQLGASDTAAELGGRVLGSDDAVAGVAPAQLRLGLPARHDPRLAQGDDPAPRRAQGAARVGRGPGRPHGEGGRGQRHLRPGQLRPVRADRVPHARDQGAGGADRRRGRRRARARPVRRALRGRGGRRPAHRLLVPAERRHASATGRPGSTCGGTTARCWARPTPAPTSTSWPRSTSRPSCCAGRWPTSVCSSWEEAIALLTDAPARLYGLRDRGRLAVGAWADVVVLDPDRIAPHPITSRADLPGDGWRLYGEADGIDRVLVNGVDAVVDGKATDARPGRVLRSGTDTYTVHAR